MREILKKLSEFQNLTKEEVIKALTPNTDAQAGSRLMIELDSVVATGRGIDTDIIKASISGFVDALNRAIIIKSYILTRGTVEKGRA
ncbi:MAG: alpha-isopropylmalate synthase regulatory domain-containing protein [Aquificaceae bacterium]